jgi:nucleotide-binding universal stress UspA family protein
VFREILVPIDGSAPSMRALRSAIDMAGAMNSSLVVMSVANTPSGWVSTPAANVTYLMEQATETLEHERARLLVDALDIVPDAIPCRKVLTTGNAGEQILHQLELGDYDLVVLGSRGLHGMGAVILGSVSRHVLQRTTVPVMIIRADDADAPWAGRDDSANDPSAD